MSAVAVMRERVAPSRPYSLGTQGRRAPRRAASAQGATRGAERGAPSLDTSKHLATSVANWLREQETDVDRYAARVRVWRQLCATVHQIWQDKASLRDSLKLKGLLGAAESAWLDAYEREKASLTLDECPAYDAWLEQHVAKWRKEHGGAEFPGYQETYLHCLYLEHWKRKNKPHGINAKVLNWEKQYFQLFRCQGEWVGYRAECCDDRPIAVPIGCNHRLCPLCSWHRSQKAQERARALFDRLEHPQFLTLTTPNLKRINKHTFHMYRERVTALMALYRKMGIFRGGVYAIETTYNRRGKTWHVHAHVMVDAACALPSAEWRIPFAGRSLRAFDLLKLGLEYDWTRLWVGAHKDRPAGSFSFSAHPRMNANKDTLQGERTDFEWWVAQRFENSTMEYDWRQKKWIPMDLPEAEMKRREQWNKNNRRVVWIKTVNDRDKAVKEVLKYITKSADFSDLPECVEAFHDAVKSARMIQTFGTWYGVKLDAPCSHEHPNDWGKMKCTCGQNVWARMGIFHQRDVRMDPDGRFRLARVFDNNSAGTVPRPTIRALDGRVTPEDFDYGYNNTDHA